MLLENEKVSKRWNKLFKRDELWRAVFKKKGRTIKHLLVLDEELGGEESEFEDEFESENSDKQTEDGRQTSEKSGDEQEIKVSHFLFHFLFEKGR